MDVHRVFVFSFNFFCFICLVHNFPVFQLDEPENGCPEIFAYENENGKYYGKITIPATMDSNKDYNLYAVFYMSKTFVKNYYGKIDRMEKDWRKICGTVSETGQVNFRIDFPLQTALPKLAYITLNDEKICNDNKDFNDFGTKIWHKYYLKYWCPSNYTGIPSKYATSSLTGVETETSLPDISLNLVPDVFPQMTTPEPITTTKFSEFRILSASPKSKIEISNFQIIRDMETEKEVTTNPSALFISSLKSEDEAKKEDKNSATFTVISVSSNTDEEEKPTILNRNGFISESIDNENEAEFKVISVVSPPPNTEQELLNKKSE